MARNGASIEGMERHAMMTTTATDDDWEDVLLVVTHTEDAKNYRYTHEPMPAGEVMEHFGGDGDAWATMRDHIIGVAEHGGEGTAFVDGHGYHVRRATRAEALGQEDREHEDEGEGRSSSDAYDEENLREQLDEALDALAALLEWEAHMGGWDAPVWGRAHDILAKHRRS